MPELPFPLPIGTYCPWCGLHDDDDNCSCLAQDNIFAEPYEFCSDCGSLLNECNCEDEHECDECSDDDETGCNIPHDCADCIVYDDCHEYRQYLEDNNPLLKGHSLIINPGSD